jgi:hypothetical protein
MLAQRLLRKAATPQRYFFASSLLYVLALIGFQTACSSKPTDRQTLVPADTLVYLETNDLAGALQPIVDSKPFSEAAKSKPDLSALKGVQIAIAVTGFQASEEKLTDEHSVGKVQPKFVAIAHTHAWNFQAVKFAEQKLGSFVAKLYDSEPKVERSTAKGGEYFTWIANDGRKAHALVIDSLIYFTNDESAIDKALAVRHGETDSIAKAGKIAAAEPATLARGYVSTAGISQIADLVALKIAAESDEEGEVRSQIVRGLPELIRSSATELGWTSVRYEPGVDDRFTITKPEQSRETRNELLAAMVDSFFENIEETSAEEVAAAVAEQKPQTPPTINRIHHREDRFTSTTSERRLVSDLGFIGWILAQVDGE